MYFVSPSTPAYYLTSVTKDRLRVFKHDSLKDVVCQALAEARRSAGFLIFGYVIMPDHLHLITDGEKKASVIHRYVNGTISRRVIDFLKERGFASSLRKLEHQELRRRHRYSLWGHHPNTRLLTSEGMLMQRVHYTHNNPVRAGLVENAEDYIQVFEFGIENHVMMSHCKSTSTSSVKGRRELATSGRNSRCRFVSVH